MRSRRSWLLLASVAVLALLAAACGGGEGGAGETGPTAATGAGEGVCATVDPNAGDLLARICQDGVIRV